MSARARLEPGETWRERAGRIILDPNDARGEPVATPADRRWLWRIEGLLAVTATNDAQRQLAADLRYYLAETCEHHYRHYDGDEAFPEHDQCLWCGQVDFKGEAANQVARVILGIEPRECRTCGGSGALTVPDADGESASEQACPDPVHDVKAGAA